MTRDGLGGAFRPAQDRNVELLARVVRVKGADDGERQRGILAWDGAEQDGALLSVMKRDGASEGADPSKLTPH